MVATGVLADHRGSNFTRVDPNRNPVESSKPRRRRFGMQPTLAALGVLAYTGNCGAWNGPRGKRQSASPARSDTDEDFCAPATICDATPRRRLVAARD